MTANTVLVGFLSDNRVQLERWGVRALVQLDAHAIEALREVCFHHLPQRPKQSISDHRDDFAARYDSSVGRIHADLDTEAADYLADLLDVLVKDNVQAMAKVRPWVESLKAAVQAHKDFHNKDEPGVAP